MEQTWIRGATVYDGTGSVPFQSDVLLKDGRIERIAREIRLTPEEETQCKIVDAKGLALCPGFVDTHSHSDLEVFRNPQMRHVLAQGITTELIGQDGSTVAPVSDEILGELADNMAPLSGMVDRPFWWRSYGEYLEEIEKAHTGSRVVGLVGHGTIRMCVMGNDDRVPTPEELEKMKALTAKCMEEGAKGISFGLIYPPGSYADTEEIVEICKVVASYDGIMMVHMRNEQDKLLESIDEMAYVARQSGIRLHISHLKALGYRNWGKVSQALEKLYELKAEGIDVTFDQYPYTATCTGLKVIVPMWAYEGGEKKFQARLADEAEYDKIVKEVRENIEKRGGAEKILIGTVATDENRWMEGKNLQEIAEKLSQEPGDAALTMLQVEGPSVIAIYFSISEEDVETVMKSDLHCVCTDGIMGAHPHPRAYGSFAQILGYYCREKGILRLEEAIRKMTSEPARRLRLWDRGLVREGMSADLVLFDPQHVGNVNSYLEPKKSPVGIVGVWVQGERKIEAEKK